MANCQKLVVNGGRRLEGELRVHGAKNSALPLLAACVLAHGECVLHNCPELTDVDAACRILSCLGCRCTRSGDTVCVDASNVCGNEIPDNLMREMRSSIVFLGAVLGRTRRCKLTFPGGCELGARPIDLHLAALRDMGVTISEEHGWLECTAAGGIRGGSVTLSFPSVGATENIMLAAVTASGRTEIHNAAREPEIIDLAEFLVKCGAKITGAGGSTICVEGVSRLSPAEHTVIPDRIVAGTYLCAAAMTRGELILTRCEPSHMTGFLPGAGEHGVPYLPLRRREAVRQLPQAAERSADHTHNALSRIPDGYSGAVHGGVLRGGGHLRVRGDDIREPLSAHSGAYTARGIDKGRGQGRGRAGR